MRPKLLLISHVLPFPGDTGQQQRVAYMLQAGWERFDVTFLTFAQAGVEETEQKLKATGFEVVVLPSIYRQGFLSRFVHPLKARAFARRTGLKTSNYVIGQLELSPRRVKEAIQGRSFDLALYEYWHAVDSVSELQGRAIPCVLDMHNVLWRSHAQRLSEDRSLSESARQQALSLYSEQEEKSWQAFDGIVAINRAEYDYVATKVPADKKLFYTPMGVDLRQWPYLWNPAQPLRLAYYGGLGTAHNQEAALRCYRSVMPEVWREFPDAELWLVGSNPPAHIQALAADKRIKVTGFVKDVSRTLAPMTLVLCPWAGTYGFRSRLVEVMATGIPVVATPDAVDGMDLKSGEGLFLAQDDAGLAREALRLLRDPAFAATQSKMARAQMEQLYDYPSTYGRFAGELLDWWSARQKAAA